MDIPTRPTHVVAIIGGAVAGSEAAALCAAKGAIAVVFEQNVRPYGKIEDGLPRWHVKLRQKEYERIDANLTQERILYVPQTKLGRDFTLRVLLEEWGFNAVILAHGAWRDRPIGISGLEAFLGKGFAYQNPFVYWFNHYEDPGYDGPSYDVPDRAIVIGGGLASIDVVKIINFELYRRALEARGVSVSLEDLEHRGISGILERHKLKVEDLGIYGPTLVYRRRKQDMPLASSDDASPAQQQKLEATRVKIMDLVMRKYLVRFQELAVPTAPMMDRDRLAGLIFRRTEVQDGKLKEIAGSDYEARAPLIVSSVGSIPEPVPDVLMTGELYQWKSMETGELRGLEGVYGLGNVLTGKGNIKDSRENAREISEHVAMRYLGLSDSPCAEEQLSESIHGSLDLQVEEQVERALARPPLDIAHIRAICDRVRSRWAAVGYPGDYRKWVHR